MSIRLMLAFAFAALSLTGAPTLAAPTTGLPIKQVVVLGDSLSDQGNLFFATTLLHPPTVPPVPDATRYDNGRFSDGPNYVDYLAAKLGVRVKASELGGSNYAFGGSRTDYNRGEQGVAPPLPPGVYPVGAFPWSLDRQRAEFLSEVKQREADPTGLYIVFHGSNDLADAFAAALLLGQDPTARVQKAVMGVVNAVLAFKAAGARTILVALSPNLGVVPSVTAIPDPRAAPFASLLSNQFNLALTAALTTIDGPNIIVFDTYAFLNRVVAQPNEFGLTNTTQACYSGFVVPDPTATVCATPGTYAFWDFEHPTTKVHAILADELFSTLLGCQANDQGKGRFTAHCAVNRH